MCSSDGVEVVIPCPKWEIWFVSVLRPDDGHHDAPKHVVVANPIASYIIKLVVVIDCCTPIYIIFTHNGNVKP